MDTRGSSEDQGERVLHEALAAPETERWIWDGTRLIPHSPSAWALLQEIEALHRLRGWPGEVQHSPPRQLARSSAQQVVRRLIAWVRHPEGRAPLAALGRTPNPQTRCETAEPGTGE